MEYPFDELHAGVGSQIMNLPAGIPDSEAVTQAKALPDSVGKFMALGKALSRQLRYREAIDAYTEGLKSEPESLPLLRLRAGRYLTTLQNDLAIADFKKCLSLEADKPDCLYRIGLAHYYAGRYAQAIEMFEKCMPIWKWALQSCTGIR
jgi:tetratricopeptide (TPR) repeat protein